MQINTMYYGNTPQPSAPNTGAPQGSQTVGAASQAAQGAANDSPAAIVSLSAAATQQNPDLHDRFVSDEAFAQMLGVQPNEVGGWLAAARAEAHARSPEETQALLRAYGLYNPRVAGTDPRQVHDLPTAGSLTRTLYDAMFESGAALLRDNDFSTAITRIRELAGVLEAGANATQNMPNATSEERAMQREATLRMAAYISENHLNGDAASQFLAEMNRLVSIDFTLESGHAVRHDDGSVQFVGTRELNWESFLLDVMSEASRQIFDASRLTSRVDTSSPDAMLAAFRQAAQPRLQLMHQYNAHQEIFGWTFGQLQQTDSLLQNVRNNFDTMITDQRFAATNQWQNQMQDMIGRVFGQQE